MATNISGVVVPAGQYPPFATVTDTDHAAWIIIATAMGLSMTFFFGGIRIFTRWIISPGMGIDDALVAGATALTTIQSCILFGACAQGLGKSVEEIQPQHRDTVQLMYYVSNLFFPLALGMSKIAVAIFLLRLTPIKLQRVAIQSVIGAISVWTAVYFLTSAFSCHLPRPWIVYQRDCPDIFIVPAEVLEVFGAIFEVVIFGLSLWLVWGLVTNVGNKAIVAIAFAFRLPIIIFIGIRFSTFDWPGLSADPFIREAIYICWSQTELNYSLMAATIPILRPLVNNLATHYGGGHGASDSGYGYGSNGSYIRTGGGPSGTGARSAAIKMSTLKSAQARSRNRDSTEILGSGTGSVPYTYPEAGTSANAYSSGTETKESHGGDAGSVGSNDSQKMIIRKDVTWVVHRDSDGGMK